MEKLTAEQLNRIAVAMVQIAYQFGEGTTEFALFMIAKDKVLKLYSEAKKAEELK